MIASLAVASVIAACSWDRQGHDAYTGQVPAAVDRYTDIPALTRAKLRLRMERRTYEDVAVITRDSIEGAQRYANLRDMHFGKGQICSSVTRDKWKPQTQERGLVYCEDGHCIIVPTVCRNVSRVTPIGPAVIPRKPGQPEDSAPPGGDTASYSSEPLPGSFQSMLSFSRARFGDLPPAADAPTEGDGPSDYFADLSFHHSAPILPPFAASLRWVDSMPRGSSTATAAPIPEPNTWSLLLIGLGAVVCARLITQRGRDRGLTADDDDA
jgi:hypothetical protein